MLHPYFQSRVHDVPLVLDVVTHERKYRLQILTSDVWIFFENPVFAPSREHEIKNEFHADSRAIDARFTEQGVRRGNNAVFPVFRGSLPENQTLRLNESLDAAGKDSPTFIGLLSNGI